MSKNQVVEYVDISYGVSDCSCLQVVKERVEELIAKYGEFAVLEFDAGYNSISESVRFTRLETDEEYADRIAKEKQTEEKKKAKEYQEYLTLKKKFEYGS